jgi:hypothetical protein
MHRPVMAQANACTSQAYTCMYCMHCPMMSQADACSYCMGYVVLISSQIYLYLQLLCLFNFIFLPGLIDNIQKGSCSEDLAWFSSLSRDCLFSLIVLLFNLSAAASGCFKFMNVFAISFV